MAELQLNRSEQRLQRTFSFRSPWLLLLLPLVLILEGDLEDPWPNRTPRPAALAPIRAQPLALPSPKAGEVPLASLVQLSSPERRFGGLSALAIEGGALLALTDTAVLVRWPKGGGTGLFRDLPGGPGLPYYKINRDSEALLRVPAGRGWWVAFEQTHEVWLFDRDLRRALQRRPLRLRAWWRNWGIEALATDEGGRLLLLPENGGTAIRWSANGAESRVPLDAPAQISDAVRLADGRLLVVLRSVRPWGISNSLGWLKRTEAGDGYRVEPLGRLPLGRWDNVEGIAAEPGARGGIRLWLVTDNDFDRRTLVARIELSPAINSDGRAPNVRR